ncbi:MAG: arginine--tRNA ligase [Epsilonproteobacteria bacterium]|nr:arginine--tRNA ligase [Campylobacterota bacterium]
MKEAITSELKQRWGYEVVLEKPKDKKFGHYATPIAFTLAKEKRKAPHLIAQELAQLLDNSPLFEKVEPIKGYVNLKLSETFLDQLATQALKKPQEFGKANLNQNLLIEFVSANPTGPLHIGHARGAVIGDALSRIGKHLGNKITKEYYINDAGRQIELLGLSIFLFAREILGKEVTFPEEYYRGEYVRELAKEALEVFPKEEFEKEEIIPKLSEWGKEKMMERIVSTLKEVGIEFDSFVSEKELYRYWDEVFELLKANGAVYEKDGKIWLKSSEYGDEKDRVVVREDKRPTYLAGDIIYHYLKFKRGYDRYINIWGADHHGYIARVKAAIKFLGFDPDKLEIVLAQMVSLLKGGEPYKMSKRAGNFILMEDVIKEIGADALRFMFLTKKSDTHLEFDIEMLKKEDSSNPIYYINYAHARINSVVEKSNFSYDEIVEVELKGLNEEAKSLLFNALTLPEVLQEAFIKREIQKVTDYLKALSAQFHSFYNQHKVLGSEFEKQYLKLFLTVALAIRVGLALLGIEAKKRM